MKLTLYSDTRNISGKRIKISRLKNRLTQQELSIKLETLNIFIDRASISKIEGGKRIVTDYELVGISKVLKVDINWLLNIDK